MGNLRKGNDQMRSLKILNRKEAKRILKRVEDQWGCTLEGDYVLLLSERQRVYVTNREVFDIDVSNLRVNSFGVYFAEIKGGVRLSIEGSQMIGPNAKKNIVELDEKEIKEWMRGEDLIKDTDCEDFVILKQGDDFLGTGKVVPGKILNFVPKTRRVRL
jgi:NOL1/NOP2/fmu family ribosome biogenesis protein